MVFPSPFSTSPNPYKDTTLNTYKSARKEHAKLLLKKSLLTVKLATIVSVFDIFPSIFICKICYEESNYSKHIDKLPSLHGVL